MRIKLLLILTLLITTVANAEKKQTAAEFTNGFFQALSSELPDEEFKIVGDLHLTAVDINGYELTIFLDNAYASYKAGEQEIDAVYSDRISSFKNQKLSFSTNDVKSILPALKPKAYIEAVLQQVKNAGGSDKSFPLYYEQLNSDLYITYIFDSPSSMRSVSPEFVKEQGFEKNIRALASKNLDAYYRDKGIQFRELDTDGAGRVFQFIVDQNYEASLVASLSFWKEKRLDVDGDLVVFTPARNIVYLVGSNDIAGIKFASEISAKQYSEVGYSISPHGYVISNGVWRRFKT